MKTRKKTKACPSCGCAFRKGRIVLRITAEGQRRQRVCQGCAALAVPVLAQDGRSLCDRCGRRTARWCTGCAGEAIRKGVDAAIAVGAKVPPDG